MKSYTCCCYTLISILNHLFQHKTGNPTNPELFMHNLVMTLNNSVSIFIMSQDIVYMGKIYLVKLKEEDKWKARDILWAICHAGKDNIDVEDARNIISNLNIHVDK